MDIEGKVLGKQVEYPNKYCPEILVAVPRSINREVYDIRETESLFCGFDVWHAYEAGFITEQGLPVSGILKVVYPSNNPFIVESKSLKLYLNSFNMTALGSDSKHGIELFLYTVKNDLDSLLKTNVKVSFFRKELLDMPFDFKEYSVIEESSGIDEVRFTEFTESPSLLAENHDERREVRYCSHLLRSNCKITKQPDWGSIFIHIKAKKLPSKEALLKYIVSLRNENHFHEEICEMTYKRLWDAFQPEILTVSCLYTRRGGVDICPTRSNRREYLPKFLINPDILTHKLLRQ